MIEVPFKDIKCKEPDLDSSNFYAPINMSVKIMHCDMSYNNTSDDLES